MYATVYIRAESAEEARANAADLADDFAEEITHTGTPHKGKPGRWDRVYCEVLDRWVEADELADAS